MEAFINNPTEWSIDGNLIGSILGNLTILDGFTGSHASISAGTTREIDGKNINFVKITYTP